MTFFWTLILIIVGAIGVYQLTKWLIYFNLPIGDEIVVLDGVLEITHIRNPGMAFGLLAEHRWIFLILSVVGISFICVYLFKFSKDNRITKVALSLVIGGGVGNMIDRTVLGEVIDMIHITIFNDFFPWVFNIADSCVCVGVFLAVFGILLDIYKEYRQKKTQGATNDDK
jgi:signal peptidase II